MKCILKALLLVFLGTSQSWGAPNDYNGIFTRDIYNQDSIRHILVSPQYNAEHKANEARTHLHERKVAAVKRHIDSHMQCKIDLCEEIREEQRRKISNVAWLETGFDLAKLATMLFRGKEAGELLDKFRRVPSNIQKGVAPESFPDGSLGRLMQQVMELKMLAEGLLKGLDYEVVQEEEWAYVERKRFLPASLQETIEESLISTRKGFFTNLGRVDYIRDALMVPYEPKPLTQDFTDDAYRSLKERFYTDPFFAGLKPHLQHQLWSVISLMYYASHNCGPESRVYRQSYYFWGIPGVGKSAAARRIATFLGLPFSEPPAKTEDEFTQEKVEGTKWLHAAATKGWFIDCLCQKAPDGKTYLNGVMIVEDFDRMLLAKGAKAEAALAFLMYYLDPENRILYSPYFKTEIDISRLTIIITANNPFPDSEKFAALRSRLGEDNIIQFPEIEPAIAVKLIRTEFQSFCGTFQIPAELSSDEDLANAVVLYIIATSNQASMRDYNNLLYQVLHKVKCRDVKGHLLRGILTACFQLYCDQLNIPDNLADNPAFEEAVIWLAISNNGPESLQMAIHNLKEIVEAIPGNVDELTNHFSSQNELDQEQVETQTSDSEEDFCRIC